MSSIDPAQDDRAITEICTVLQEVTANYRFGSSAYGTAGRDSDVDLAVLTMMPLDPAVRFDLQERLAMALRRSVDLVDLQRASPVMAIQIVAKGVLLYDGHSGARGAFEDSVYGAYARLNEERRGILDRITAEGTVYGG